MGGCFAAERERGELLMADYLTTDTELTSIADAIRAKGGTSESLTYPAGYVSAIEAIPTGGGGATEYTIQGELRELYGIRERLFPISENGLSLSDLSLQDGTIIWMAFDSASSLYVWQDSNEDDTFTVSIPAGTKAYAYQQDDTNFYFTFSAGYNAPFGWLRMTYDNSSFSDEVLSIASYGDSRKGGCVAQKSGYGTTKVGTAHIPKSTLPSLSLHILVNS